MYYVSLPLHQIIRSITPGMIYFINIVLKRQTFDLRTTLSIATVEISIDHQELLIG